MHVSLLPELFEVVRILVAEALDGCASGGGELTPVVDGLVRAAVDVDRSVPGQHRDDGQVDERDRRDDESVLAAEELDQALLDLRVEDGAAEHPRPAWMRAPLFEVLGDGGDNLAVEVEAEVVAGGEVGQPLVADPDHAAVDLVDDGVGHGVRPLELGQLAAGGKPTIDPTWGSGRGPRAVRTIDAHSPHIGVCSGSFRDSGTQTSAEPRCEAGSGRGRAPPPPPAER